MMNNAACFIRSFYGRSAVQFIIDYYDRLPASIAFIHGFRCCMIASAVSIMHSLACMQLSSTMHAST